MISVRITQHAAVYSCKPRFSLWVIDFFFFLQEQRLRFLKMQEQQQREQEKLRLLRENAENQEAKLRRVRALKGQVEQKRLSNSKLGQNC